MELLRLGKSLSGGGSYVSPLSRVMCPHLMFPYLVCFLSLFNVIISSFMSSRVCLIIYDLPVYISSCLFSLMSSGLLRPRPTILVRVFLFLPRVCAPWQQQCVWCAFHIDLKSIHNWITFAFSFVFLSVNIQTGKSDFTGKIIRLTENVCKAFIWSK